MIKSVYEFADDDRDYYADRFARSWPGDPSRIIECGYRQGHPRRAWHRRNRYNCRPTNLGPGS